MFPGKGSHSQTKAEAADFVGRPFEKQPIERSCFLVRGSSRHQVPQRCQEQGIDLTHFPGQEHEWGSPLEGSDRTALSADDGDLDAPAGLCRGMSHGCAALFTIARAEMAQCLSGGRSE